MFGLLDDIDRQDVKDFLNSAVDNTADLYDTVTEYDYSNMFDDIGNYFRGLLSDEPASPMSSKMGSAFGSRGGGRVMSPTADRQKNIERLLQERQRLYSMGYGPQSITKTAVEVSPGRPRLMDVLQSVNAMGPKPRTGLQDVARNYRRDYPEYKALRDLDPPPATSMTRLMRSEYPFNRTQMMEDVPLMKRVSPERRQLAEFARRNPGGMRNAPDYGSEAAVIRPARAYGLIDEASGEMLANQASQMANKYFDRLRGF